MGEKYEQYLICKERGHNPDPNRGATMNAVSWAVPKYVCVYCGTTFWSTTKTTEHEENAPKPTTDTTLLEEEK